jgi:hypothetical protein
MRVGNYLKRWPDRTLRERTMEKVMLIPFSTCWLWSGAMSSGKYGGYGLINVGGNKIRNAHRVVYELHKGAVPEGLDLDHLCRSRWCVNPEHLEPVTRKENLNRGARWPRQ